MKYADQVKEYDRDGIAVLPGVFSIEEVNRIRGAALMALSKPNPYYKQGKYLETKDDKFPALIFWPSLVEPYLNEIRMNPKLAEIVMAFLGPNVKQLNNQIYFRMPGDKDEFAWHQDVTFRNPRSAYPGIESSYLQTIIVVDEITLENSPVEFIRGSQTMGEHDLESKVGVNWMLREFKRHGLEGEKVLAKPGDVMIWSVMTVHGSEANESQAMRMTYMNGFAKADAAPNEWPLYLSDGEIQPLPNFI